MSDHQRPKSEPLGSRESRAPQLIDTATLLQGRKELLIEHNGEIYRLMLTRNNKLLLQK